MPNQTSPAAFSCSMVTPRITRSIQATMKSTDKTANSIEVQAAPIEDGDTDADGQEKLPGDAIVVSDLGPDDHTSPERSINQEKEGGGDGAEIPNDSMQGNHVEQIDTPSLSAKMQHVLKNVHRAWDVADVNTLLDAAICPSAWTERPAKELSKLARATGVYQRAWAVGQLRQLAGGRPLTKSIIQQVYDKAVAEGKIELGRSRKRPRAPASVPDTPQAQKRQQQQPQTPTDSYQLGRGSARPASRRAASAELGRSPLSLNSNLPTEEAQENEIESDLAPGRDMGSRPRSSQHQRVFDDSRNSRDLRDLHDLSSSQFPSLFGRHPRPITRPEATSRPHSSPSSHLHRQYRSHYRNVLRSNSDIVASNVSREESVPANTSVPSPSSSSQQTPPPTSSPHSLSVSASTNTTVDAHRLSLKRKAAALVEEAFKQSEIDVKSAQNRLRTLEAKNNELTFDIVRNDREAESALRNISDIEAQIASQKSELSSMEKLFSIINAPIEGSDPQARQALVQCQHQKQSPFLHSGNIRHDIVTGGMDATGLTNPVQDNAITTSPADRCVPCQFELWQTASQAEFSARKQDIQELEARHAQAQAAQQEQCGRSSRLKEEIEMQAREMETLREEIKSAQAYIEILMPLVGG